MNRATIVLLALFGSSAVTSIAAAQQEPDIEAEHRRGNEARTQRRDEDARVIFQRLWERTHEARAMARMALAEQELRRYRDAETHLTEALAMGSDPFIAQHRAVLESALQQARAAQNVSVIELSSNVASAEVFLNGARIGGVGQAIRTSPGTVSFEVRAADHVSTSRSVVLTPGQNHREVVNLTPSPSAAVASPTPRALTPARQGSGGPLRTLAWIGAAGAGALLIVGGVTLGVREGQVSTAMSNGCLENEGTVYGDGDCPSLYRSTNALQVVGVASLVTGALLAAASAVLFLVPSSRPRESASSRSRFQCGGGPGQFGASCGGEF